MEENIELKTKIYTLLDELNIEYIKNDVEIINPHVLDIYIPSLNLAFAIDGNMTHSELQGKDKKYHIGKSKLCESKGIKLVHIYEDEIEHKFDIVVSRIKNLCYKSDIMLYARKCKIVELDYKTKHAFLARTHIQGDTNSAINIGLEYDGKLVSVMTFANERVIYRNANDRNFYELIRFANELNMNVVGSFSKMFKYFIEKYKPNQIKTFADIRWSGVNPEKTVYFKNGFNFDKITEPSYWYMDKTKYLERKHRFNFTKHNIITRHPELDTSKTEWVLMQELQYDRIWDCGTLKFFYVS